MIDKNLFLETLHEVAEIAATSSEKIKPEEVHRYFEGMELSEEQEKMVYISLINTRAMNITMH